MKNILKVVLPLFLVVFFISSCSKEHENVKEEEVTFQNGDLSFSGTLSVPNKQGKFPAVVLISGSGAHTRDGEVAGFKVYKTLADQLVEKGVIVLRYDDRGVGESSGDISQGTTEEFAGDVLAAVDFLRKQPKVDTDRIGLVGHSEGGLIAPIAANRNNNINFLVLIAPTGVKGDALLLNQQETMLRSMNLPEDFIRQKTDQQQRFFSALRSGEGWNDVREEIKSEVRRTIEQLPSNQKAAITNMDEFVDNTTNEVLDKVNTPWFKFFIDYDPTAEFEKVNIPTFVIFGEKDQQVTEKLNLPAVEKSLNNGKNVCVKLVVIPGANHLFQAAQSGSPMEYSQLDKAFAPGFSEQISEWILEDSKKCLKN